MEKVWVIEDTDDLFRSKTKQVKKEGPLPARKNPAKAYSLSIFFWGGGQLYNGQPGKGLAFLVSMIAVFTGTALSILYGDAVIQFLRRSGISLTGAFLTAEIVFLCALLFWTYNAGDAYHGAVKERKTPFPGVTSRVFPFLCSLLIPGWGQFLNGQPIKGSIFTGFSILGFFSLVSIPAVVLAWPFLEASDARFLIETVFAITVLFAPLIPFLWVFSSYDALQVSLDDYRKEPLWERIKAANNRRRTQGWVRGIFPRIKTTLALGLILTLLVILIYYYFPAKYYLDRLAFIRARLAEQGMTIIPGLVDRLLSAVALNGK